MLPHKRKMGLLSLCTLLSIVVASMSLDASSNQKPWYHYERYPGYLKSASPYAAYAGALGLAGLSAYNLTQQPLNKLSELESAAFLAAPALAISGRYLQEYLNPPTKAEDRLDRLDNAFIAGSLPAFIGATAATSRNLNVPRTALLYGLIGGLPAYVLADILSSYMQSPERRSQEILDGLAKEGVVTFYSQTKKYIVLKEEQYNEALKELPENVREAVERKAQKQVWSFSGFENKRKIQKNR